MSIETGPFNTTTFFISLLHSAHRASTGVWRSKRTSFDIHLRIKFLSTIRKFQSREANNTLSLHSSHIEQWASYYVFACNVHCEKNRGAKDEMRACKKVPLYFKIVREENSKMSSLGQLVRLLSTPAQLAVAELERRRQDGPDVGPGKRTSLIIKLIDHWSLNWLIVELIDHWSLNWSKLVDELIIINK